MRERKHGCDVKKFCFSRANHASTEDVFYCLTIDPRRAAKGFLIERDWPAINDRYPQKHLNYNVLDLRSGF